MSQVVGLPNNSYKHITNTAWVCTRLCKLQKGCTRLATASDKVYQLLAHGRWFSPGTPDSSTTKTGRHDIAEILLKVALKHQNQIKSKYMYTTRCIYTAPKKKYVIFVVLLIPKNTRTQHNSKYIKHMYTIIRTKLHIHLYIIHSTRNT